MKIKEKIEEERSKLGRMIEEGATVEEMLEQSEVVDGYIVEYMKGA